VIRATGLGSGLDIESLVTGLVSAEGDPVRQRLLQSEAELTTNITAYSQIKSSLTSLKSSVDVLNSGDAFTKQSINSSSWSEVRPTLSGAADVGPYNLAVSSLAASQTLASQTTFISADAAISTGTLSISLGTPDNPAGSTYTGFSANSDVDTVAVTIDSTNNTIGGLRDAINASNAAVNASIVKDGSAYRLLIVSTNTGVSNSISISVTSDEDGDNTDQAGLSAFAFDGTTNSLTQTRPATDAAFSLNGLSLSSESNTVSNVLNGLDLELKAITASVTIDVSYNDTAIVESVSAFVTAYNNFVSTIQELTSYDSATGSAGELQGESLPRAALSAIRNSVVAEVSGLTGSLNKLNDVGILTTNTGALEFTSATLSTLLLTGRDDVKQIFSGDKTSISTDDGVSGTLSGLIDNFTSSSGLITSKTDSLTTQVDRIGEERERLDERLLKLEDRYYRQFNAMDALIARLTSTGDFLLAQLASMPAANRDKK
jgi:flagellar hook-associated protein 2